MAYRELPAPRDLTGVVRCLWIREVDRAGAPAAVDVLPDGCIDLVVRGGSGIVAGPDTRPVPTALTPGGLVVGLRFHPGAAPAVLGVPAHELRDARVPLEALLGAAGRRAAARCETGPEPLIDLVRSLLGPGAEADALVVRAAGLLERAPHTPVPALAAHVGLGERQLRRRFDDGVGYGPKRFARVARFQRMLALVRAGEPLARVAAEAGYADQAHMANEAAALARRPPTALRAW